MPSHMGILTSDPLETRQSLAGVSHIASVGPENKFIQKARGYPRGAHWTSVGNYPLWKASKEMHSKVWKEHLGHTLPGKTQAD